LTTPGGDDCGVARDVTWQVRANNRLCVWMRCSGPPFSAGTKDEILVIAKAFRADGTFHAYGQVPGNCEPVVVWRTSSDSDENVIARWTHHRIELARWDPHSVEGVATAMGQSVEFD
jgi:hypothetical protein